MPKDDQKVLKNNVFYYTIYKTLTKRVYLPVITLFLVNQVHLNLQQIATLVPIYLLVTMAVEIPSGYFADRFTRKSMLVFGSCLVAISPLFYIIHPSYISAAIASILFYGGYSFTSGAAEALMHDSLAKVGREDDYVKILSRAQTYALVINLILVFVVPFSYKIDPRMPFGLGSLIGLGMVYATTHMIEVGNSKVADKRSILTSLQLFVHRKTFVAFFIVGLLTALQNQTTDYMDVGFMKLHLEPQFFGLAYAAGGLLAAVASWYNHYLRDTQLSTIVLIDFASIFIWGFLTYLTKNIYFSVFGLAINTTFFRMRLILYQNWFINKIHAHNRKATLISTLNFFGEIQGLYVPVVVGTLLQSGEYFSRVRIWSFILVVLGLLCFLLIRFTERVAESGQSH